MKTKSTKKKRFSVKIKNSKGEVVKDIVVGGKKQALIEAINISKKPIKDPVHIMGIKERTEATASVGDLWDCVELIQGIFLDWSKERPWLLYPVVEVLKISKDGKPKD